MTDTIDKIELDPEVAETAAAVRDRPEAQPGPAAAGQAADGRKYPERRPGHPRARQKPVHKVDVLLVNPPSPEARSGSGVSTASGGRSRENMIWPQVSLAQLAAMIQPRVLGRDRRCDRPSAWTGRSSRASAGSPSALLHHPVHGANADQRHVRRLPGEEPSAPGRWRSAHVTPMVRETLEPFPGLDFVLRGEPEYTFKELVETLGRAPGTQDDPEPDLSQIKGLGWRRDGEIVVNPDRPVRPGPRRSADAAAPPAAARQVPHPADQGAVHVHRDRPRLHGRLHLLHQARQLSVVGAAALAATNIVDELRLLERARHPQHPHVRRPVHRQSRAGGRALPADHRRGSARSAGPATAASTTSTKRCSR